MITDRAVRALDDRLGGAAWIRGALKHVFPDHWSFLFGEAAAYAFLMLVGTGVFLTFFYDATLQTVVYHGSYAPLNGLETSGAYASVVDLSFDVPAGLLVRQMHHWAALVFVGLIAVHAARIFFTGAFRKPREINWLIGTTMLVLAIANGFAGYSMVDDLLSGIGLRIAYSIGESIPVVGVWLVGAFFGSEFPGDQYLGRLFILHVLVVPGLILALLSAHLMIIWRQKHTQFPGGGRTERNVVGTALFPTYAARSAALLLAVVAVLAALGGLAQINPIWLWGPFDPAATTTAAQPDWYVGWLEGSLRLFPPWEVRVGGYTIPNPFFPGVLLPALFFLAMYAYPFVERRLTGDRRGHELLDRPRDHPVRTGVGVGVLSWFTVLVLAGSQDVIAAELDISVQAVMWLLRILLLVVPAVAGAIAWSWCRGLARATTGSEEARDEVHERWTAEGRPSTAAARARWTPGRTGRERPSGPASHREEEAAEGAGSGGAPVLVEAPSRASQVLTWLAVVAGAVVAFVRRHRGT